MTLEELERELAKLREAGVPGKTKVRLYIDCKRYAHSKRRTRISYWLTKVSRAVVLPSPELNDPGDTWIQFKGSGVEAAYEDPWAIVEKDSPLESYRKLMNELLSLRAAEDGDLPVEVEASYVQRMDDLWWQLSEEEQAKIELMDFNHENEVAATIRAKASMRLEPLKREMQDAVSTAQELLGDAVCKVCGGADCRHLWKEGRKCCPDCTHK